MALEPELTEVLAESRNYDELLDAYIGWRNVTGPKMKDLYAEFVELYNKGARDTGHEDAGKMWRSGYDMPVDDFENLIETTWQQVLPLYEQLHCYAGQKLAEKYGADKVLGKGGLLPAHLFGNMWSQDWIYISDLLKPFPDVPPLGNTLLNAPHTILTDSADVTPALKKQGYNAVKMHELAENFYKSLGYKPLPQTFWNRSMLDRPKDREVVVCVIN
jgi:peptidyl-dipeptidase A